MISKRLVSGVAVALFGVGGIATAASALRSDSRPATPEPTSTPSTVEDTSTMDPTLAAANTTEAAEVLATTGDDGTADQVDDSEADNTDDGAAGDAQDGQTGEFEGEHDDGGSSDSGG